MNIMKIIITEKIDIVSMVFDLLFIQLFYVNIFVREQISVSDAWIHIKMLMHINI